jgi:hypothetical protein
MMVILNSNVEDGPIAQLDKSVNAENVSAIKVAASEMLIARERKFVAMEIVTPLLPGKIQTHPPGRMSMMVLPRISRSPVTSRKKRYFRMRSMEGRQRPMEAAQGVI